jgi:hypothetical protein
MNQKCGQCQHFQQKKMRDGTDDTCCKERTVLEFWEDRALTVQMAVWPNRDASGCAVYAA